MAVYTYQNGTKRKENSHEQPAKMSIEEENTQRFISRANRLGYMVLSIEIEGDDAKVSIKPCSLVPYTPQLEFDEQTEQWHARTADYGALDGDEIQKVAEGYQRAAAMINDELRYIDAYNVVPYNVTD